MWKLWDEATKSVSFLSPVNRLLGMAFQGDSIFWVEVEKIVPNPYQPRREFDENKLRELAESIRMYGILQPLTVTRKEIQRDDGAFFTEYELIAGERRLRASKLAGVSQVPVIIRDSDDSEQEKLELAIIENLQREDLNAVDRALAFRQLADAFKLTHDEVAKKVGRSRMYVSNSIRLLLLPDYMLDSLKVGDISEGHARTLLMLKDRPEELDVVYREILLKKLSVREVERIVRKIATDKVRKKTWKGTDPVLLEIEKEFTDVLGTRVFINKTDYGGKVTIDYFSEDDLQKLLRLVKQPTHEVSNEIEGEVTGTVVQSMAAMTAAVPLVSSEAAAEIDEPEPESEPSEIEDSDMTAEPPEAAKTTESPLMPPPPTPARYETEPTPVTPPTSAPPEAVESTPSVTPPAPTLHETDHIPVPPPAPAPRPERNESESADTAETQVEETDNTTDAMRSVEASTDAIEDYVLERAINAGAEVSRPTPEEKVVQSADLQRTVNQQIANLQNKESSYTPPASTNAVARAPESEKSEDSDESDLYSVKGFSL